MSEPLFARLELPTVVVPRGVFWADHLKTVRGKPLERLVLSLKMLPLPGAFREAAIASRAIIRERRKANQPVEYLLEQLYRLAVLQALLVDSPYIEGVGAAFDVAEASRQRLWEHLDSPYEEIGYRELPLLSKTDIRWLRDAWGDPKHVPGTCRESNAAVRDYGRFGLDRRPVSGDDGLRRRRILAETTFESSLCRLFDECGYTDPRTPLMALESDRSGRQITR